MEKRRVTNMAFAEFVACKLDEIPEPLRSHTERQIIDIIQSTVVSVRFNNVVMFLNFRLKLIKKYQTPQCNQCTQPTETFRLQVNFEIFHSNHFEFLFEHKNYFINYILNCFELSTHMQRIILTFSRNLPSPKRPRTHFRQLSTHSNQTSRKSCAQTKNWWMKRVFVL